MIDAAGARITPPARGERSVIDATVAVASDMAIAVAIDEVSEGGARDHACRARRAVEAPGARAIAPLRRRRTK